MTYAKIQLRRGTAAEWYNANPTLADGESGYERDSNVFKVGDGVTAWRDLPAANPQYLLRSEYIPGASMLSQLTDVAVAGATSGQALTFDGTAWTPQTPSGGGTPTPGLVKVTPTFGTVYGTTQRTMYSTTYAFANSPKGGFPCTGYADGAFGPDVAGFYDVSVRFFARWQTGNVGPDKIYLQVGGPDDRYISDLEFNQSIGAPSSQWAGMFGVDKYVSLGTMWLDSALDLGYGSLYFTVKWDDPSLAGWVPSSMASSCIYLSKAS